MFRLQVLKNNVPQPLQTKSLTKIRHTSRHLLSKNAIYFSDMANNRIFNHPQKDLCTFLEARNLIPDMFFVP